MWKLDRHVDLAIAVDVEDQAGLIEIRVSDVECDVGVGVLLKFGDVE